MTANFLFNKHIYTIQLNVVLHLSLVTALYLSWFTVFYNLSAEVTAGNGSQVLLIALSITSIFVEHIWCTSLGLSCNYFIPELLSFNCATAPTFLLITINNNR